MTAGPTTHFLDRSPSSKDEVAIRELRCSKGWFVIRAETDLDIVRTIPRLYPGVWYSNLSSHDTYRSRLGRSVYVGHWVKTKQSACSGQTVGPETYFSGSLNNSSNDVNTKELKCLRGNMIVRVDTSQKLTRTRPK